MPFNFSLWTLARWCLPALIAVSCAPAPRQSSAWRQLPSIPDAIGFAAPFAGVSQDALLVAGGANFPVLPPWAGGRKEWHRSIFVLPAPDAAWIPVSTLPRAAAYGVSVSWRSEVICAGGCDAEQHFRDVFALRWVAGRIETVPCRRCRVRWPMVVVRALATLFISRAAPINPRRRMPCAIFGGSTLTKRIAAGWNSNRGPGPPGCWRWRARGRGVSSCSAVWN